MEPAFLHLQRELEYLDLLLHREVMRLRARYQLTLDEFRGLYISDAQVDDLLRRSQQPFDAAEWTQRAEAVHARNLALLGSASAWSRMALEFRLSPVEQQLLVLAIASAADSRYETLCEYLNNDVNKKHPTHDLALRLYADFGAGQVRVALAPGGTLFRTGLFRAAEPAGSFLANPIVTRHILAPGAEPSPPLRWQTPHAEDEASLDPSHRRAAALLRSGVPIILPGPTGSGRSRIARGLSRIAGLRLLSFDARDARLDRETAAGFAEDLVLEARLAHAALFVTHADAWCDCDIPNAEASRLVRALESVPVCFACGRASRWSDLFHGRRVLELRLSPSGYEERLQEWARELGSNDACEKLARHFVLTSGQIRAAAQAARDRIAVDRSGGSAAFFEAARTQCGQALARLAVKVAGAYRWDDLVLPASTLSQVREAAAALGNRRVVYEEWKMRPRSGAFGLNILFSGGSGTGKTMAAGVIAADAGLDLYRIDLSAVISKYIGETEKSLDRLFAAARDSNAIVFFDEADALFGKRSEVRDAHDRYANIEVAYLLQKMEEHDGVVILATNLAGNIDEAFARRIHFHVEFPMPGEQHREQIWRRMFPSEAPLSEDVDFHFLARQFVLSGGQIRSIAVDAAFLAARNGCHITMRLLIHAVARQLMKQGCIPTVNDFQQHFASLREES